MATKTVHTLAYKLITDTKDFDKGVVASRTELNKAKRVMREVATPAEKLEKEIKTLNTLFRKGAIDQETYTRKLDKLQHELEETARKTDKTGTKFQKISKGFSATIFNVKNLAGVLAGAAVVRGVQSQIDKIDELAKAASALGTTTEFLSRLQFTSGMTSGLTDEQTLKGIEKFTRRISEAAAGTGEAKTVLEELGLDAKKLVSLGPEKAFLNVARAMDRVTAQHDRLRIATKLFDDEQAKIHTTLALSNEQLADQFAKADKLGRTISSFDAAQMEAAKDAMTEMETSFNAFSRSFTTNVGPSLTQILNELTTILNRMAPDNRGPDTGRYATFGDTFAATTRAIGNNLDSNSDDFLRFWRIPANILKNADEIGAKRIDDQEQLQVRLKNKEQQQPLARSNRPVPLDDPRRFQQWQRQEEIRWQQQQLAMLGQLVQHQQRQTDFSGQIANNTKRETLRPENAPVRLE